MRGSAIAYRLAKLGEFAGVADKLHGLLGAVRAHRAAGRHRALLGLQPLAAARAAAAVAGSSSAIACPAGPAGGGAAGAAGAGTAAGQVVFVLIRLVVLVAAARFAARNDGHHPHPLAALGRRLALDVVRAARRHHAKAVLHLHIGEAALHVDKAGSFQLQGGAEERVREKGGVVEVEVGGGQSLALFWEWRAARLASRSRE